MFFGNGCVYVWKINLALACLVCCSAVLVFLLCLNVWSEVWTFICLLITQNRSNIYFLYCIVWPKLSFVPLLPRELNVISYQIYYLCYWVFSTFSNLPKVYEGLNGISCHAKSKCNFFKSYQNKKYCLHLNGSHSLYIQVTAHCLCQLKIVIPRFNFGVETHLWK